MKNVMMIFIVGLMLISLNVYAQDDVSIDSGGNVTTGVSNTYGNFEVTGASAEHAIMGTTSGTGAVGVIGVNSDSDYIGLLGTDYSGVYGEYTTNGNYGKLGGDLFGVYGYSTGSWAGYFEGNARVTGNLTVDGNISGETDPVFSGSSAFGITSEDITNWNSSYGWGDHGSAGYDTTNDAWTGTGDIYTTSGNVGIGTTTPTELLTVAGTIESTSGGIKFPDGTIQTTASAPTWHQILPGAERFVTVMNYDQAVLDKETGLVWERLPSSTTYTWIDAILHCLQLNVGGRMGWHLPTIEQLASLVDTSTPGELKLPIPNPFMLVQSGAYWSGTTYPSTVPNATAVAWFVNITDGFVTGNNVSNNLYSWCVRGGQSHNGERKDS